MWAADIDAATTALPARDGIALAQQLAGALFDGETSESTADGETSEKAAGGCESSGCC
jgi:predicted exporter